jgi:hypothetical protein
MDKIVAAAGTGGLPPHAGGKKDKSKLGGKKKTNQKSDGPDCGYCGKKGHLGINCYINPKSDNYSGGRNNSLNDGAKCKLPCKEWEKKQKAKFDRDYANYEQDYEANNGDKVSE